MQRLEGNSFPSESFAEYADHSLDHDDLPYEPERKVSDDEPESR